MLPIDHDKVRENIELALVRYKHKLARLKAAYPAAFPLAA